MRNDGWWSGSPDLTPEQREIVRREDEALTELERERQAAIPPDAEDFDPPSMVAEGARQDAERKARKDNPGAKPDQEATVGSKKTSTTKTDRYTTTLPVPLVDREILERADLASHILQERDECEARMKADASQHKATIAEKETKHRQINEEIRQKRAYKPVDCERVYDYGAGHVSERRLDTGEEIMRRDMTHAETQRQLDFEGGGKGATEKPAEPEKDPNEAKADEAEGAEEAAERIRAKKAKRGGKGA